MSGFFRIDVCESRQVRCVGPFRCPFSIRAPGVILSITGVAKLQSAYLFECRPKQW